MSTRHWFGGNLFVCVRGEIERERKRFYWDLNVPSRGVASIPFLRELPREM